MGRFRELVASRQGQENEIDLDRRMVTAIRPGIQVQAGGREQILATVPGFTQADAYVDFHGDAGAIGSTLRLYAISATGARVLEALLVVTSVASALRISAGGRGCRSWELTYQRDPASPAQSEAYDVDLTSFDGTITTATITPAGGGAVAGTPLWDHTRGSSKVVKASAGQFLQAFGSVAVLAAAPRYLLFFDAAALPPDGTAPDLPALPLTAVDTTWQLSCTDPSDPSSAPGKGFTKGICWCVSSTANIKTIDNASTVDAEVKFQ